MSIRDRECHFRLAYNRQHIGRSLNDFNAVVRPPDATVWVNFGFVLIPKLYIGLYASVGRTVVMNILFEMEDFRLALEAADAGLWQWDYACGKVNVSAQSGRLLGFSPTEMLIIWSF